MTVMQEIEAERRRQIEEEGFDSAHDDAHCTEDLIEAALCYYQHAIGADIPRDGNGIPLSWPWGAQWWKPKDKRRDLIRAGALCLAEQDWCLRNDGVRQRLPDETLKNIVAEIDALDRAASH